MKYMFQIFFLFLLASISASAQWNEGENRSPVPDTNWRVSSGEFAVMLLITNDPDGFFDQWNKPSSPNYKPHMSTVEKATRGDTVMAITLFSGCETDEKGNCDCEIDFKVLKPDGSLYAEHNNAELWIEKLGPPKGSLQVSRSNLGLEIEADDPIGEYVFEVTVRDNNAHKELKLKQHILVREKGASDA